MAPLNPSLGIAERGHSTHRDCVKEPRLSAWQQETGERIAQLETQVEAGVTGNGQPGGLRILGLPGDHHNHCYHAQCRSVVCNQWDRSAPRFLAIFERVD